MKTEDQEGDPQSSILAPRSSPPAPPPLRRKTGGQNQFTKRAAIGTAIGAAVALLILLLLLLLRTDTGADGLATVAESGVSGRPVDTAARSGENTEPKSRSAGQTTDVANETDPVESESEQRESGRDAQKTADRQTPADSEKPSGSGEPNQPTASPFVVAPLDAELSEDSGDADDSSSSGLKFAGMGGSRTKGGNSRKGSRRDTETLSGSFKPGFSDRIAVTQVGSDDIGSVLAQLGPGYNQFTNIKAFDLQDAKKLEGFDVLFINCGALPPQSKATKTALRDFVERGGTIYASDLQYPTIATTFPEARPKPGRSCAPQQVKASVVEEGLAELLGRSIALTFDAPGWRVADFYGKSVTTYLKGSVAGRRGVVPLLVKFPLDDGQVIFTSFHNSAQTSETEEILLKYLVFSAVTAAMDLDVARQLGRRGLRRDSSEVLSASSDRQTVKREYECKDRSRLEFVLAFEDLGARLRLQLTGPNGETLSHEGTSTFSIEVPDAAVGTWQCEVIAQKLPFANFPFTLTIASGKQ